MLGDNAASYNPKVDKLDGKQPDVITAGQLVIPTGKDVRLVVSSREVIKARFESPSNGRMMSRTSPSTLAASAALARPGPIAAATSAGVDPSGISFTDPSGSAILNIFVIERAM